MTYQARQADLTGGAANFFLATPLEEAVERFGPVDGSVMSGKGSWYQRPMRLKTKQYCQKAAKKFKMGLSGIRVLCVVVVGWQ